MGSGDTLESAESIQARQREKMKILQERIEEAIGRVLVQTLRLRSLHRKAQVNLHLTDYRTALIARRTAPLRLGAGARGADGGAGRAWVARQIWRKGYWSFGLAAFRFRISKAFFTHSSASLESLMNSSTVSSRSAR